MQFLIYRCDLFLLTWFGTGMSRQRTKSYLTAGLLCIFVSLSMINTTAYAQSESSQAQEVEVPQALGPDAMKELVSKLNEKQTAALIE